MAHADMMCHRVERLCTILKLYGIYFGYSDYSKQSFIKSHFCFQQIFKPFFFFQQIFKPHLCFQQIYKPHFCFQQILNHICFQQILNHISVFSRYFKPHFCFQQDFKPHMFSTDFLCKTKDSFQLIRHLGLAPIFSDTSRHSVGALVSSTCLGFFCYPIKAEPTWEILDIR